MKETVPDLKTLLARGARRRCPRCGEGALMRGWFKLRDECPVCGLKYLENQGDAWGGLVFLDRVLFIVPIVLIFLIGRGANSIWPYIIGSFLALTFVLTFPHRLGMTVAFDYRIRATSTDLS